nr:hypothetical protein [Desulfogranum mediterraneum]
MAYQVLGLLQNRPLSKSEIARARGKNKPTRYLNELMKKMVVKGYVAYTIPEKPTSRLQKYRITEQGKALLQPREN